MKKGYMYTIEILIAASIILIATVFIFRNPPDKPEFELSVIHQQGIEAFQYLDRKNLKELVYENNETEIERQLASLLPFNVNFDAKICHDNCISENVPANSTVIGVDYYVASYKDAFLNKKVKLWMWEK